MSAKLTPEEIAAFCDAVDLLRKYHDNTAFGEEWHQMAAANKRVKENLPKLRAMAEPEKEELPLSEEFLQAFNKARGWVPNDADANYLRSIYRQFREWSKNEDESRARAVADERIEAATIFCPGLDATVDYKLKRGAE